MNNDAGNQDGTTRTSQPIREDLKTLRQASEKARDPEVVVPKPCPFCGEDVGRASFWFAVKDKPPSAHVFCLECHTDGPHRDTLDEAIAAWNRRADTFPLIEALEGAERALEGVKDMLINKPEKKSCRSPSSTQSLPPSPRYAGPSTMTNEERAREMIAQRAGEVIFAAEVRAGAWDHTNRRDIAEVLRKLSEETYTHEKL